MHKFLKNIGLAGLMTGICLSSFACEDEFVDEAGTPEIYELVEMIYSGNTERGVEKGMNGMSKCSEMTDLLTSSPVKQKKTEACNEYTLALEAIKVSDKAAAYKHLAENQMNSGFYTAAYILVSDIMDEKIEYCKGNDREITEAQNAYKDVFEEDCGSFWDDAKKVMEERLLVGIDMHD
ncbi:MAG: hypothetical protein J6S69_05725 [Proteobacteria bacterium]|nr:hypothetical protein [Pseudomonadota bacterium]